MVGIGWQRIVHQMWQVFYGDVRAGGWRKLGTCHRLPLLSQSVSGIVHHEFPYFSRSMV